MCHDIERFLTVTFSGIRIGEEPIIKKLLSQCGLYTTDISEKKLINFLVARWGGEIIGTIGIEIVSDNALVRSLAISDKFRGQGVGKNLSTTIEGYARSKGVKNLYLITTTAEIFFAGRGYTLIPQQSAPENVKNLDEFQRFTAKTAVCMYKKLGVGSI